MKLKQTLYERNKANFICAIIGAIFHTALTIGIAFLLMDFTDVAVSGDINRLKEMMIKFCIYLLLFLASDAFAFYFKNRFIEKGIRQYKQYAFQKILSKHIASFQKENTSTYISALTNDVNSIELNYMEGSITILIQVLMFVGGLLAMGYLNITITLTVIVACLIPLLTSVIFGKSIEQAEKQTALKNANFTGLVKDLLSGFPIIKSFQVEQEFSKGFSKDNQTLEQQKRKKRDFISMVTLFSNVGGMLVQVAIFAVGAYLTIKGNISVGTLIAFVQLANYVITPLQILPASISNKNASQALIDKMETSCQKEEEIAHMEKISFDHAICLRDVSFAYEEGNPILSNINITFEKGKNYAIVGGSGCGKSTLLQLLLGYHDFDGDIVFDESSIKEMRHDDIFELCSLIQQNVFLFDDSILHNVTMLKEFDEERVLKAVKQAGLETLWNEKGQAYACGENGCHLSGGEKQRISIARSLLKNSSILLFDEATASLDPRTAKEVEHAIVSLEGVTNIVVTHKIQKDSLCHYDEIIVLGNHRVMEQGNFDELYERKGYFYSLVQLQG